MSNLVFRLPRYYQDSPPVSELERVLGAAAEALMDAKEDALAQLFVETATWGLATRRPLTARGGSASWPSCGARGRPRRR